MYKFVITLSLAFFLWGCSNSTDFNLDGWNELPDEVVSGGVPKDGIPSITNPQWDTVAEGDWLSDTALVAGIIINGQAYAYPHKIMDQHEIVNEPERLLPYTLSFCPLTGSSVAFEATISGSVKTFGVSGLLLQNNLIMYDRQTDSNWPQLRLQADEGELRNTKLKLIDHTEIEWGSWKNLYPGTLILSRNSGGRNPSSYLATLYQGYRRPNSKPLFPMNYSDSRLMPKIRVLGVYAGTETKAYPMSAFGAGRKIFNDSVDNVPIAVFGDKASRMMRAFFSSVNGQNLTFKFKSGTESGNLNNVRFIDDQTGSTWNLSGEAIDGTLKGERLERPDSFVAYWFAWSAFNRSSELWGG